jgi:ComF family protein
VPVPLHPVRYRTRGFNQAAVLARAVAKRDPAAGRFAPGVLARTHATERQARLGLRQRAGNVETAFASRRAVDGSAILLVDDVLTTGATARACARVLLDGGARDVDVLVLARTPSTAREPA